MFIAMVKAKYLWARNPARQVSGGERLSRKKNLTALAVTVYSEVRLEHAIEDSKEHLKVSEIDGRNQLVMARSRTSHRNV